MAGEIQLNGVSLATESSGIVTVNAVKYPSGHVIATYQSVKTDTQLIDETVELITDLTLTVTPKLNPTKFLITAMISQGTEGGQQGMRVFLYKDGSVLSGATGDASSSRRRVFMHLGAQTSGNEMQTGTGIYLDSNSGTSNVTYAIYAISYSTSGHTVYVNRSETDTDSINHSRTISTLTIQEIVP